jgi:DNA-binding transcriptional regulator YhcF (GntR family)
VKGNKVIRFYLDSRSGMSPYLQLVHQVRRAVLLGLLKEGDQLPTVKAVVATLAINPNTVSKAYRELEYQGLVIARSGVGTFVTTSVESTFVSVHEVLQQQLVRWIADAREADLSDETIEAIFGDYLRATSPASA